MTRAWLFVAWLAGAACGSAADGSEGGDPTDASETAGPEVEEGETSAPEAEVVEALTPPLLEIAPDTLDFGVVVVGQSATLPVVLRNGSDTQPLRIDRVLLIGGEEGCAGSFCLPASSSLDDLYPSSTAPWLLTPGEAREVSVRYAPTQAPLDPGSGLPALEHASLWIHSNADPTSRTVPIVGAALPDACPLPVILIEEGQQVEAPARLHLYGGASTSANGAITGYQWQVDAPQGAPTTFAPSDHDLAPTFDVTVVGKYVFTLHVEDEAGYARCDESPAKVWAVPKAAVRVELTWTTPGDADPDDTCVACCADLDLHLAHPNASQQDLDGDGRRDPWFDPQWDVWSLYPTQSWGDSTTAIDDPGVVLDSAGTCGPEAIDLDIPEQGKSYAFGVHVIDDHGFGPSLATVRVYGYAQLLFEVKDVPLRHHDMWWTGTIDWPSIQVKAKTTAQGGYFVTPDYWPGDLPRP